MPVQLFVTVVERPQSVSAGSKVICPSVGQGEALATPIDQKHLKTLFKTSEGAADSGSGNSEFLRGTTQSAGLGSSNEHHNVIGVLKQSNLPFLELRQTYESVGICDRRETSLSPPLCAVLDIAAH